MICRSDESKGDPFIKAPCGEHFVCADDIASFFEYAINDESLYPPKCCNQIFLLDEYKDHIPADIASAYHSKEQGEYSILAKYINRNRLYCANPPCSRFLHPSSNAQDALSSTTYGICKVEECGSWTCVHCKTLLDKNNLTHTCISNDTDEAFKQIVLEKGYQRCFACGATVELAEACNHIRCICGTSFCYVCGKPWAGFRHGCPRYGPAIYDAQGYNQNGFHRDTGLNRAGRTSLQQYGYHEQIVYTAAQGPILTRNQEHARRFPWLPLGILHRLSLAVSAMIGLEMVGLQGKGWIVLGAILIPHVWEFLPTPLGNEYDFYDDVDDDIGFWD
ncbi:hypothetical protein J3E72DRAFT_182704 [Bipolaris maydis]|nr:hypothetical protein J3E74DRAFT_203871 [Bipolaris maydis]KAJ6200912.1 hypothetical protein J3E72DRAFT_182704 [Bipolaris maydis]KAJ6213231.1 hypothetical protein PSV09DRAFT_2183723 [Bipolaris maydis]